MEIMHESLDWCIPMGYMDMRVLDRAAETPSGKHTEAPRNKRSGFLGKSFAVNQPTCPKYIEQGVRGVGIHA